MELKLSTSAAVPTGRMLAALKAQERIDRLQQRAAKAEAELSMLRKQFAALRKENKELLAAQGRAPAQSKEVPAPRKVQAVRVINTVDVPSTPEELKGVKFNPTKMQGRAWFNLINGKSKARSTVEGYWREAPHKGVSTLPFPVIMQVPGFDKEAFCAALTAAQRKAMKVSSRGFAPNRWTGKDNGDAEYTLEKWTWPSGYINYVKRGVPPSAAFYKFITGKTLAGLPTYGR